MLEVLLILAGVMLVGGLAWLAWRAEKKRREALLATARELGFAFDPSHDRDHDDRYAHFEVFRRGHSRAAFNTMTGSVAIRGRDWPVRMGDFRYRVTRRSGKRRHTTTHRFSYLIVHVPFPGVPDLLIRPEGLFDKLAGAFGFDDIDFESAEFSRRFHVRSPDRRFAYGVVHPRMMEFLLEAAPEAVDLERGRCCLADGRSRWEAGDFVARLSWIGRFFELWPDHVVREMASRG